MNKPLTLSIVIPAYNEAVHVNACLDAIAKQTVMPDEVIVIDNNSTDNTAQIAKSYPFVKVLSEHRQGIAYARNAGFNASTSTIIGRIDVDTLLPPGWVEKVKKFYHDNNHANCALSGPAYYYNIRWPRTVGAIQHFIAFRLNRLLMGHDILWGSNLALPKVLWEDVRPRVCERADIHEDLDLAIHLHRSGHPVSYRKSLRVGAEMRRIHVNRDQLWQNLLLWPRTLRVHGYKTWVFAWLGALFLYSMVPMALMAERLATMIGRRGLNG